MNHRTSSIAPVRGLAAAIVAALTLSGCSSDIEGTQVVRVTQTVTSTPPGTTTDAAPAAEPSPVTGAEPQAQGASSAGARPEVSGAARTSEAPVARACSPTLRRYPDLDPGARGPAVEAFQCLLRQQGATVAVDGAYGPATRQAYDQVARRLGWQAWVPHVETHVWTLLLSRGSTPRLRRGSTGEAVARVQRALVAQDVPVSVDGRFGADTERAVRTLQTQLGMTADGIVGPGTWRLLQSGGGPTD